MISIHLGDALYPDILPPRDDSATPGPFPASGFSPGRKEVKWARMTQGLGAAYNRAEGSIMRYTMR
jgi:hypothetical protein